MSSFIEENHQRHGIRRKSEYFGVLRYGNREKPGAGGGRDFHLGRDAEKPDAAFHFLGLLYGERDFMFRGVVLVAEVKPGGAGTIQPLGEKLIDIPVRGFFNGFR